MNLPKQVEIVDVGPRDGLQNIQTLVPTEQKVKLINGLTGAGVRRMEATSFVHPKWVPQLADAEQVLAQIVRPEGARFMALIPNLKGYERAKASGAVSEVALVVAASETMNQKNVNMLIEASLEHCRIIIDRAKSDGISVRGSIGTAFGCPYEGLVPVQPVLNITQQLFDMGADEVMFADTIGCANPAQVYDLFVRVKDRWPEQPVAAHFHDTRHLALANALAAVQAGVRIFDASVGGLGGCPFTPKGAGNVATERLVFMFHEMGIQTGIDYNGLLEVSEFARSLKQPESGGSVCS
ncbi:MAG: hydroxymethylglutaryl-CoA lyase [Acidobacteria bacterium]|nr:hydroxymethylglutaryl-CoA lyase [Acidobacteriota bacterium]